MKKLVTFICFAAVLCGCQEKPFIDVQAHRGGAGLMPENTVSAMQNALDMKVNTLEFDLQLSADGQVVVSHDNYFHPRYATRPDGTLIQEDDPKEYLYDRLLPLLFSIPIPEKLSKFRYKTRLPFFAKSCPNTSENDVFPVRATGE